MNIELLVVDADTGEMYDVSELAKEVNWTTSLDGSAGQLSFSLATSQFNFPSGSDVVFRIPNVQNIFRGRVFTTSYDKEKELQVVAYDQTWYLRNKYTYVFKNKKAHEIFEIICKDYGFTYKIADAARIEDYICVPFPYDFKALSEIIQKTLDDVFIFKKKYLFVRDVFGVLTLDNIENYKRPYLLNKDLLTENFSYSRSIDSDVYNEVALERVDKATNKKLIVSSSDQPNKKKWGTLRLYEQAEDNATEAELRTRVASLLAIKNRPKEKLSFTCEGKLDIFAGCGIQVDLSEIIPNYGVRYCIIQTAQHMWTNNEHKMQLEVIL